MNRRFPDFVVVGAMKCATSTLHEQLAVQPGIFMSTPKEPNFFSDEEQWNRGIDWYTALFAGAAADDLCGESSTHYTKLPTYPLTVQRMMAHLPRHVRFIYIMRDPIDRLVSQYIHEWTQRVVDVPIDAAIDTNPEMIAYSRYAMQLQPLIDAWGRERILPLFFEHFTRNQQATLERVCRFIGYRGTPRWHADAGEQNVSSERMRASAWRDAIANFPGMTTLRRTLIPRRVRDRIKGVWMMKHRPQLSDASIARLRTVFDADLAVLGRWFGIPALCCENFKAIARETQPAWHEQARAPAA